MEILRTRDELRVAIRALNGKTIGLVPTMGFLHEGHLSLMQRARRENDVLITTIFVNPTQFGPNEDLDRYPRDPEGDAARCQSVGVDYLWMPSSPDEVYPTGYATTVQVRGLTDGLCGASRPGHFDGVSSVVCKLLNATRADRAYFGEKDFQQLAVIRRMVIDLDLNVEIINVPTVRDDDGLALSSRNKYLTADDRQAGLRLSEALERARDAWNQGERSGERLERILRDTIAQTPSNRIDYAEVVDALTLRPLRDEPSETPVAVLAVFVGTTRLIDNARLDRTTPLRAL